MNIGLIGLGKMGANMSRRLAAGGHEVIGYDRNPDAAKGLAQYKIGAAGSLKELVEKLEKPRVVWVMVPSGAPTEGTINELADLMDSDDVIIDGGNSNFKDGARQAKELVGKGIHFMDVGTSGGLWGLERGYCLMVGGPKDVFSRVEPILKTLAPGHGTIDETPDRPIAGTADQGYIYCGPAGSGHFVKMVHNGIEYGMMQAFAEGFDIMENASSEALPEELRYDLNLADIAEVWRRGSVVSSWLLDLAAIALTKEPGLDNFTGYVHDSGEGRWTIEAALAEAVPANVLSAALYARFRSRQENSFADRLLSALRFQFGGHVEESPEGAAKSEK